MVDTVDHLNLFSMIQPTTKSVHHDTVDHLNLFSMIQLTTKSVQHDTVDHLNFIMENRFKWSTVSC
jgi:hypothetical protein